MTWHVYRCDLCGTRVTFAWRRRSVICPLVCAGVGDYEGPAPRLRVSLAAVAIATAANVSPGAP